MKSLFIVLMLSMLTLISCCNAQQFVEVKTVPTTDKTTVETVFVSSKPWKAIMTDNDNCYIIRVSKEKGKTYKQYLGYKTPSEFHGNTVFTNKDESEYWYFVEGKTGFPSKRKLKRTV